jgi:phage terminase large subunit
MFLRDPALSTDNHIVPRITYDPRCTYAIKEHGQYHYPDAARQRIETNPSERPVDVDNHTLDATRYGYYNYFPSLFNEQEKQSTMEYADYSDLIPDIAERVSLGADY